MIFENPYSKKDWMECRKRTYQTIGLDALLYDAQQNVRLSVQCIYYVYIDVFKHRYDSKPLPDLINHWIMDNISEFFKGDIESDDLVSQSKNYNNSNRNNRFNPFLPDSLINLTLVDRRLDAYGTPKNETYKLISECGIKELKDSPGIFTNPQFSNYSIESLRKAKTKLNKREARLQRIEQLLDMYYQANSYEKEQIIFNHLKKHYDNSMNEQKKTSKKYLI